MNPFRPVQVLEIQEKIESLCFSGNQVYLGTAVGNLFQYGLPSQVDSDDKDLRAVQVGAARLSTRRPVEQVCATERFVFILLDGALHVLPADIQSAPPVELCKDVKQICLHTGSSGDEVAGEICVATRKKLIIFANKGGNFQQTQEIPTSEAASALVWHQNLICAGFRREYKVFSDRTGLSNEGSAVPLDGKFVPRIIVLPGNELLLLIQESVGLVYNLSTRQPSQQSTIPWPRKVTSLGASGNYVFVSFSLGQLEIFKDQKKCQSITLEGTTTAMSDASSGRFLVALETSVMCLNPIPFERQVKELLLEVKTNDALDLINATFSPEDPERQVQFGRFHAMAGWALFRDLQFAKAFQHFMYSTHFGIEHLLLFWRRYLPDDWKPPETRNPVDGAPEPCDVTDFVRARLQEKQPAEAGDAVVSANVDVANAVAAPFLLKQREALLNQERMAEPNAQGAAQPALQRAIDTLLLKLLLESNEDDLALTEVLERGVKCQVEDCEGFLRQRGRLDMLARLCKAHERYDLALREWSLLLSEKRTDIRLSTSQIIAEMVEVLRSCCASNSADLLRQFVPQILAVDPPAVLPVFTANRGGVEVLSADEVLKLLEGAGHPSLVLGFLEDLVQKKEAEPRHCAQLGFAYVAKVEEELSLPGAKGMTPARTKFLRFIEDAEGLDSEQLLPRLEALQLHEERVVLCSRENKHYEALQILSIDLNDLSRAEIYCRLLMAREAQRLQEKLSVFSANLPTWARGIVFGPKKPGAERESQQDPAASLVAESTARTRPLMLFLRILLDAHTKAGERPEEYKKVATEYREAILELLMGYAGHVDLPPNEVLGILPSNWTLEGVAEYLSKCARICLHQQRASMLEENLSSMAYLKTFSAWTKERMRKVQITGDRCCPVCNKRFVDKDNVGKAFVAYPNETCVHFTCKEHPSICPKTGKNFSDNLSVYCQALGTDAAASEDP